MLSSTRRVSVRLSTPQQTGSSSRQLVRCERGLVSRKRAYVLPLFLIFFEKNNDSGRPVISASTGPIISKVAGLVRVVNDLKLVFDPLPDRLREKSYVGLYFL